MNVAGTNDAFIIIIIFLDVSRLSCSMRDLSLWCAGFSLVVVRGLSCSATCRILVP